ncbi:polyprenyl synthetase family protein [Stutzerimonas nosocomialis]|uniref:polyprenyl synthetase family protein n=1 Tax=Stutzerimonas nosocomialis TaxID=1056496 RepID=UPI001108D7C6|nr:polyprenyl synthetase family protein [Stutzerimonas nosocomialis]TLX54152.1 polyprenyl synthetase family protein [Stutzerimonas nosocomialis]
MALSVSDPHPDFRQALGALRTRVDTRLGELLPSPTHPQDSIAAAMREGALAPGKRIRPLLLLLALQDLDQLDKGAFDVACALEMIHAASLFLDDMPCMDDASLRRGRPTIHVQFGEDVAILAAVALLSHAFSVAACAPGVAHPVRTRMVCLLSQAIGPQGLVRGQYVDLREGRQQRSLDAIASANQLKTGSLFTAAVEIAALLGRCDALQRKLLFGFAVELGHAFQLLDDLDDSLGSHQTGKDSGKDEGKSTVVSLLGADHTRQRLKEHLHRAEGQLARLGLAGGWLHQLLECLFARAR